MRRARGLPRESICGNNLIERDHPSVDNALRCRDLPPGCHEHKSGSKANHRGSFSVSLRIGTHVDSHGARTICRGHAHLPAK